ncbi:type IV secretion system protein [Paracoccus sp. NBH48]|nr:type IV secretion system protein [Paracoccus sp. NBH48]
MVRFRGHWARRGLVWSNFGILAVNAICRPGTATEPQVDVVVTGINLLGDDRVQVRMRKRLTNPDGSNTGNFTAVIGFDFATEQEKTLEAVWQNPLGFTVTDYQLYQDRRD